MSEQREKSEVGGTNRTGLEPVDIERGCRLGGTGIDRDGKFGWGSSIITDGMGMDICLGVGPTGSYL